MKVSICIITYNHQDYIAQALDSVLAQQVDFDFEIVVGDDCSPDQTPGVLRSYANRFPGKIRLLLRDWNMGPLENYDRTLRACRGEYVAQLEGDDFWTSPHKLQKQIEFLDGHPDCPMCFHKARMFYEDGSKPPRDWGPRVVKKFYPLRDILRTVFIHAASTVFRRQMFDRVPHRCRATEAVDWAQYVLLAMQGDIGYINETMSAYRIHEGGIWSDMSFEERFLTVLRNARGIKKILGHTHQDILDQIVAHAHRNLAEHYQRRGEGLPAIHHLIDAWRAEANRKPIVELARSLSGALVADRNVRKLLGKPPLAQREDPPEDQVAYYPPYDWTKDKT